MKKIILIIIIILLVVIIGINFSMISSYRQTENNTSLFEAELTEVSITDTGNNISVKLSVKQYDTYLYVTNNVCNRMDKNDFSQLVKGDKIYFRIGNNKVEQMEHAKIIDIVSLKTQDEIIFSLNDYNEFMSQEVLPFQIASIVVSLVLITLFLLILSKKTGNGSVINQSFRLA